MRNVTRTVAALVAAAGLTAALTVPAHAAETTSQDVAPSGDLRILPVYPLPIYPLPIRPVPIKPFPRPIPLPIPFPSPLPLDVAPDGSASAQSLSWD